MILMVGMIALVVVLVVMAVLRVSRVAGWRSVAMIAISTGSLRACIEFIRFCEQL
jgi:hypothetical protein